MITATAVTLASLTITLRQRDAIDRDTNAFIEGQRNADQIVALTYRQQLEAYRYLQQPDAAHRDEFQRLGDDADAHMRRYLFQDLSPAARLQVERMKETHESFEITAQRAFDLAGRGDASGARARLVVVGERAATLDRYVTRFLQARIAQRSARQQGYDALAARVRLGILLIGAGCLVLVALLSRRLHRQVLVPLEQLIAVAQRIRHGDADARVTPQRYAELRLVATAFNEMADGVQLSREATEIQNEELRQSLDQLQSTQEELVQHEKLSAMGQMLAGLAHELNNPLGAVLGMAQVLRAELAGSADESARRMDRELAEPIEREALRARSLVRSLLTFARKPSGTLEPVSLSASVSTAVGLRSHAYVMAGRTLQVNVPQSLHVLADVQKLLHSMVNLINNALDAMSAGQGTSLSISAFTEGDDVVRLDFDDDGPGFADPRAAFTPFYTTKPAEQGTGLGLSLVQKFVNEFGGSVSAVNRPGGGARVSLHLRRAAAPSHDAAEFRPAMAESPAGSIPAASVVQRQAPAGVDRGEAEPVRQRVLVVDDEPSLREVQRRLLMLEGLDVVVAAGAEEAREILAREPIDLVVSDLRMPGPIDGRGLLELLAREYPHLAARALLVTGDVSGAASAALPVPPERLISKPFARQEYVARVRAALAIGQDEA